MDIDTKIEKAMKDENITKVMHKASNRFRNQLDQDSIYTCQLNALWKAFLHFNPEKYKNVKFTTYLYNGVFIECLKEVKFHQKHKRFTEKALHENLTKDSISESMGALDKPISFSNKDISMIDILDEARNSEELELIMDKFNNMTINEMAKKRNSNRETVRKKLKNVLNRIRKNVKEVY